MITRSLYLDNVMKTRLSGAYSKYLRQTFK